MFSVLGKSQRNEQASAGMPRSMGAGHNACRIAAVVYTLEDKQTEAETFVGGLTSNTDFSHRSVARQPLANLPNSQLCIV